MLEYLAFENVGPAPAMEVEFAPRVNLITGDNGLGKSFLLDSAWWVPTGAWPAEVNRRMTSGLPARPRDLKQDSTIRFRARYAGEAVEYGVGYSPAQEAWTPRLSQRILSLVVYAHADGSFSVWDTARNNWPRQAPPVYPERRPPYVFTETEVWDGLRTTVNGERTVPLCNGLLHDWSSWIKAKDAESKAMAQALRALSPDWDGGPGSSRSAPDAWFDLDLDGDPPRAHLRRRPYTPQGTPGAWLTSEAFDLATDRGSIEAERAILRARQLLKQPDPPLDDVMAAHAELRSVLPDVDRFWVRWNAFVERAGGEP